MPVVGSVHFCKPETLVITMFRHQKHVPDESRGGDVMTQQEDVWGSPGSEPEVTSRDVFSPTVQQTHVRIKSPDLIKYNK